MASTIKLKNSTTAGNSPSSLETGEIAINVADGNLFYGSASAVLQNFVVDELEVKGNLTAQQYIVSSSVTHMTQSFSSGSTVFGDTQDDTHLFTGSISVTGSVTATSFVGDGSGLTGIDSVPAGTLSSSAQIASDISGAFDSVSASLASDIPTNNNELTNGAGYTTNTGTVDTSGTPADNQVAVFTDSNTIEGSSKLLFDNNQLDIVSSNNSAQTVRINGGVFGAVTPYISPMGISTLKFGDGTSGHNFDFQNNKIVFDADSTNSYIQADTSTPENIEIHADGNIELRADDELQVFSDIDISGNITASGDISASGNLIIGGGLEFGGDSSINTINSGDDLSINPERDLLLGSTATDVIKIGRQSGTGGAGRTEIYANTSTVAAKFQESTIEFNHPITASGDISASGDITCDNITIAGDITSVGDDITVGDNIVLSSVAGQLQFHGDGTGGGNEGILYQDSGGGNRFGLIFPGSNVVALVNRASNGNVEIRANNATAGGGGESTVATFRSRDVTFNAPVTASAMELNNVDVSSRIETYRAVIESSCYFGQTTKRYLPFNSLSEQSSFNYLSVTPAAANGKLISITIYPQSAGGSTVAGLHINSNATAATTDTQTISAGTPVTFTFSSNNTFSQNDELSFSLDPTNNINGMSAQIVLEYDY